MLNQQGFGQSVCVPNTWHANKTTVFLGTSELLNRGAASCQLDHISTPLVAVLKSPDWRPSYLLSAFMPSVQNLFIGIARTCWAKRILLALCFHDEFQECTSVVLRASAVRSRMNKNAFIWMGLSVILYVMNSPLLSNDMFSNRRFVQKRLARFFRMRFAEVAAQCTDQQRGVVAQRHRCALCIRLERTASLV